MEGVGHQVSVTGSRGEGGRKATDTGAFFFFFSFLGGGVRSSAPWHVPQPLWFSFYFVHV